MYDLLSLSLCSLTFFLSLWRSHNSRATLQIELNAIQQHTLSLGERKDYVKIKKSGSLEVFGKGCMDARGLCRLSAQSSTVWQLHASSLGHAFMRFISPRPCCEYDRPGFRKQRCLRTSSAGFRKFGRKPQGHNLAPGRALFYWLLISIKSLFLCT